LSGGVANTLYKSRIVTPVRLFRTTELPRPWRARFNALRHVAQLPIDRESQAAAVYIDIGLQLVVSVPITIVVPRVRAARHCRPIEIIIPQARRSINYSAAVTAHYSQNSRRLIIIRLANPHKILK
jgi:hypothetical protein